MWVLWMICVLALVWGGTGWCVKKTMEVEAQK